ncbi:MULTISPECIES: MBL fold metallo-hydrolase [unclassified Caulobacter]|uniref:MBL fold metallo-hydrolase n=1 Tax=unclassified Caulobacter TaxID=2648921 RepID=UPI000D33C51F|nr:MULTISPECIES: MBL fold metallo-hydrolase [unclassified Caulobacter]PTS89967.1 MBL fold metallo-hydrolase [Caulobacter sp. HMWF009]PTT07233.1 MBL fold metallo-hydrolase [Caulobacter sp. HMWF025]
MLFEQVVTGGCLSYLVGCPDTLGAVVIDPEISQIDRYRALATRYGLQIRFIIDTHTHADHFSAAQQMSQLLGAPTVMHVASPAPHAGRRLDDGEMLIVGNLRIQALHTPGHTRDSMCLIVGDRVFTGDTLLIGGTGRTDLPTGDPDQLYDSLFGKLLTLDPALLVYPAHDYKGRSHSTLGAEIADNPRLQKREREAFIQMMRDLNLAAPTHMTEALRTNMTGGKTVGQLLAEAAAEVPHIGLDELSRRLAGRPNDLLVLDVREEGAFKAGHIPGAHHLPRGQLELRVNDEIPDPTLRIVTYCEFGKISTLAAATLRGLGFMRATALDGGMKTWRESGYPVET